ncbi:MAG: DUF47 domain-containing protein [Solirubrobacterales bacterium]
MKKYNFFDKMFPKKYDFFSMLIQQCKITYEGINSMESWIKDKREADYNDFFMYESEADKIRFKLEEDLLEAFMTPFDRQDIYSISIEIDKVIECCKSSIKTIRVLKIEPDLAIISMVQQLCQGARELTEAISILESNPKQCQIIIENIRKYQRSLEELYILGLSELFNKDAITVLKYREVYNYLKEAASLLGRTVDIYHRICVRLA